MDDTSTELTELFATLGTELPPEVLGELQSTLRLHGISPQELFYKWESYSIKMGAEETNLDLKTARDFKKDIQEALERENRGKAHARNANVEKRQIGSTSRAAASNTDVFGLLDGLVPNTPRPAVNGKAASSVKRKGNFETPTAKASKNGLRSSPSEARTPQVGDDASGGHTVAFADRPNAGQIVETLNDSIEVPDSSDLQLTEPRIKLKANTELSKFSYKTMAMKLSEASEVLDDRIDEFITLVQTHHGLDDSAFGNPSSQSTSEIVAVGRIASDTNEGRLNAASLVLETSRRTGAGLRVPLRVDGLKSYEFFPGKIVAVRGTNASGDFFTVTEVLPIPLLPPAASSPDELAVHNARASATTANGDSAAHPNHPLTVLIGSGPYTPDTDFSFEAFHALLARAAEVSADALILTGPFLDIEHPLLRTGAFALHPSLAHLDPDTSDLTTVFRTLISGPLHQLTAQLPHITVLLVPSTRDAVARHVSWPQDRLPKKALGLPRQCAVVPNPATVSANEVVLAVGSADVLDELRRAECVGGEARQRNLLARLVEQVVEQRHFFPVFPPADRAGLPRSVEPAGLAAKMGVNGHPVKSEGGGTDANETNGSHRDGNAEKEPATEGEKQNDPTAIRSTLPDAEEAPPMDFLPMGAMLDTSYLKLGEWPNVRPDVLITPSVLTPFAKVVHSVLTINPGTVSKRRGPGTYARLTLLPATVTEQDRQSDEEVVSHKVFERARVDIVRI